MKKRINIYDVILGIVAVMLLILFLLPFMGGHQLIQNTQKVNKAEKDIRTIQYSLDKFLADNGFYPSSAEGLLVLLKNPDLNKFPNYTKYFDTLLIDPWGEFYLYNNPGVRSEIDIYSYGADKVQSEDDVGNWSFE